jgi:hypothetical protein
MNLAIVYNGKYTFGWKIWTNVILNLRTFLILKVVLFKYMYLVGNWNIGVAFLESA